MANVDTLKKAVTSCKRNLTRFVNAADRAADFAQLHPTSDAAATIRSSQKRVEKAYGDLLDSLDALCLVSDDQMQDAIEKEKDTKHRQYEMCLDKCLETLELIDKPTPANPLNAPAPAAAGNAARARVNDSLKPSKLLPDNTPAEFRSWTAQFRSFYNTSRLDLFDLEDQHSFFRICLDSALVDKITPDLDAAMPIFGAGSCIELLTAEFEEKYPLATRRFDYFSLSHDTGQQFSDFSSKLRRLAREADLTRLPVDQLHVFRYITACSDDKLRDKFLEHDSPTLADLDRIVRSYERGAATAKSIEAKAAISRQGPPNPKKPSSSTSQKQTSSTKDASGQTIKKPTTCYGCGGPFHENRSMCPHAKSKCKFCGRKGHTDKMCFMKRLESADSSLKAKERGGRKVNKTSNSPATDSDSSDQESKTNKVSASLYRVAQAKSYTNDTPRIPLKIRHKKGEFGYMVLPDSGATCSLVAAKVAHEQSMLIRPSKDKLYAADDSRLHCEGRTSFSINGVRIDALVSSSISHDIVLSWSDLVRLGILPADFPSLPGPYAAKAVTTTDIIKEITADFKDILTDSLPDTPIIGPHMTIELIDDAPIIPKKIYNARPVPLHWQKDAKAMIDQLIKDDIIEEVHDQVSDWISPAFFVPKPNGKLRLVTDFTYLNRFVKRPVHPFPSADDIIRNIPQGSRFFAKLDAVQGYHQVPLAPESRPLTTFLLPWGKFRYKRGPMGLKSTSDVFCDKSDKAIVGVPSAQKIVDDILLCAPTLEILRQRIRLVLDNCRLHNLAISHKKLVIGPEIEFAGFIISEGGVLPNSSKLKALSDFPAPTNISEVRAFLGLANQLGGFVDNLASVCSPLRSLLKKGSVFSWSSDLQAAFDSIKGLLLSPSVVSFFDPSLPTTLLADASCLNGLGFALLQYKDKRPYLIQCGSRSLSGAESRYAPVELEALGITWAINKCRHYLLGCPRFTVVTDHNPLLGIFRKDISDIDNRRLQRFRENLQPYSFDLIWAEGKSHLIADAFSRAPVDAPEDNPSSSLRAVAHMPNSVAPLILDSSSEPSYLALKDAISSRTAPSCLPPNHPGLAYKSVWHLLSLSSDGRLVVYDGSRVVVPLSATGSVASFLHAGHCGFTMTKSLAQTYFFWPGMTNQIKQLVESCQACLALHPSLPKEPLQPSHASFPMELVGVDLFSLAGKSYLCMVDRFSGFCWVHLLRSLTTSAVTTCLLNWFLEFGFPRRIRSDGGPQFRSDFLAFCDSHNVAKETSSPYYPQSNGLAESGVKSMKRLLKKSGGAMPAFKRALLIWRNTPKDFGYSPAQLFFGFGQNFGQSCLSTSPFVDRAQASAAKAHKEGIKNRSFDSSSSSLDPILPGTHVLAKDPKSNTFSIPAIVVSTRDSGRSYVLATESGDSTIRNRRDLIAAPSLRSD